MGMRRIFAKLDKDTFVTIIEEAMQGPVIGQFKGISEEGIIEIGTTIEGTDEQIRTTLEATAQAYFGNVPSSTFLDVKNVKRLTIFSKYAKKKSKN